MKPLAITCVLLAACGGGASLAQREPDEYVGCATDENWPLFDENVLIVDDTNAPFMLAPADDATVPDTPVDITWQPTPQVAGDETGDVAPSCAQWSQGYSTLHLPPVTGTVYDVRVVTNGVVRHRVLTTLQKWTASADTWTSFAGSTVQLEVHRLVVTDGARTDGPYAPTNDWQLTISK